MLGPSPIVHFLWGNQMSFPQNRASLERKLNFSSSQTAVFCYWDTGIFCPANNSNIIMTAEWIALNQIMPMITQETMPLTNACTIVYTMITPDL